MRIEHVPKGALAAGSKPMKRIATPDLSAEEFASLRTIAESAETPRRVAKRALILLFAAERKNARNAAEERRLSDHNIAAQVDVCADTVRSTLKRLEEFGFEAAVYDKPFVRKVTEEAEQLLLSLIESPPPTGMSRWTLERLAQALRDLRVVESISDTSVWDILQKRGIRIERTRVRERD